MSAIAPTMPATPPGIPGWIPPRIRRMTVEEYERMAAAGIIPSSNRYHLINGYVVEKMTHNPPHAIADELCGVELARVVAPGWHVRGNKPIRLPAQLSEPEPDRSVVRGALRDYEDHHPGPADIALVVEVSDATLAEDRSYAANLYGPAGIPACWIVDVNGRRVEVYTGPGPKGYAATEVYAEGHTIPVAIDGQEVGRIAVADILPRSRPAQ